MPYFENIEKIFNEEVREKRKTGSGSFHKRGKGVKHGISGAFRTPYYFMKTKERKKLNGEVSVFNMYETILTKAEFDLKDKETQVTLMTRWREIYKNSEIMEQMGVSSSGAFHNIINGLDLPKKNKWDRTGGAERKPREATLKTKRKNKQTALAIETEEEKEVVTTPIKPILITNGLHLEYNGEYDSDQLNRIFTKLQLLTEGEQNKFNLSISITERT